MNALTVCLYVPEEHLECRPLLAPFYEADSETPLQTFSLGAWDGTEDSLCAALCAFRERVRALLLRLSVTEWRVVIVCPGVVEAPLARAVLFRPFLAHFDAQVRIPLRNMGLAPERCALLSLTRSVLSSAAEYSEHTGISLPMDAHERCVRHLDARGFLPDDRCRFAGVTQHELYALLTALEACTSAKARTEAFDLFVKGYFYEKRSPMGLPKAFRDALHARLVQGAIDERAYREEWYAMTANLVENCAYIHLFVPCEGTDVATRAPREALEETLALTALIRESNWQKCCPDEIFRNDQDDWHAHEARATGDRAPLRAALRAYIGTLSDYHDVQFTLRLHKYSPPDCQDGDAESQKVEAVGAKYEDASERFGAKEDFLAVQNCAISVANAWQTQVNALDTAARNLLQGSEKGTRDYFAKWEAGDTPMVPCTQSAVKEILEETDGEYQDSLLAMMRPPLERLPTARSHKDMPMLAAQLRAIAERLPSRTACWILLSVGAFAFILHSLFALPAQTGDKAHMALFASIAILLLVVGKALWSWQLVKPVREKTEEMNDLLQEDERSLGAWLKTVRSYLAAARTYRNSSCQRGLQYAEYAAFENRMREGVKQGKAGNFIAYAEYLLSALPQADADDAPQEAASVIPQAALNAERFPLCTDSMPAFTYEPRLLNDRTSGDMP